MAKGEEPQCLLDYWMVETVREMREAEEVEALELTSRSLSLCPALEEDYLCCL